MKKRIDLSNIIFGMVFLLLISVNAIAISNFFKLVGAGITEEASLFNKIENKGVISQEQRFLIPVGSNFGIKIYTDGVIVSSLQDVSANGEISCPAKDAGIREGDYIISINGETVQSNKHFLQILSTLQGEFITLEIKRQTEIFETKIKPFYDGNVYRLGMWIRDSAGGIGTLTYYDPTTGEFGGLGHGICDVDTGTLLNLKDGDPAPIEISGIIKGEEENPGKICGYFSTEETLGTITKNSEAGIFGTLDNPIEGKMYPVASKAEITEGDATILATVEDNVTKEYQIKIEKIDSSDKKTKNFIINVTDDNLLSITGGIIQGMSGSPILQNGRLIGAVTHVFVNDPTRGYGIFIENMLESAESIAE